VSSFHLTLKQQNAEQVLLVNHLNEDFSAVGIEVLMYWTTNMAGCHSHHPPEDLSLENASISAE